ncbi:vanadium-dependent haloperoxidase [Pelagicoccus sp. SDUM812003]|uniref:vanadium-dependent haloperoxidase n=1 Tax=Pelagicoccus sp. SDUM812003 TaxID=3041267 RepID=UPI00280C9B02|nr:vanadium-dependent haloperoxidase [Pelagicoccus sp. SDUM812003]MDQ8202468.1 vanadium-dependent haloperoxidase [Pelagicoccus sp. SDUM812003]
MKNTLTTILLASLASLSSLRADSILDWNEQMLDAIRLSRTPPPQASYALAVYHASIYDAVNGIEGSYQPYYVTETAPDGADREAAAAEAARVAFMKVMGKKANPSPFLSVYKEKLAEIPDGPAKQDGLAWGKLVAERIIALRENDGTMARVDPVIGETPGVWKPTPPFFRAPTDPHWGNVKPFTMKSGDQFRPKPPPAIDSEEFAEATNEVQRLGHRDSTERSEYETNSTIFWSDDLGTATPPGHWNVVAQDISREQGLSFTENARLFALLNLTAADAGISVWEAKYHYNFWRPENAIREADTYEHAGVVHDPEFIPLMPSPTFPDYTSGHSTFSRACTQALTRFFGTDKITFSTVSEGFPGDVRTFHSFSEAAKEVGRSRIFGGIHYKFADIEGQRSGKALANYVADNFLLPR